MKFNRLFIFLILSIFFKFISYSQTFWVPIPKPGIDTIYQILSLPNDTLLFATSDSAVFYSNNYALTLNPLNTGIDKLRVFSLAYGPSTFMFAGSDSGGVYRSINNGANWSLVSPLMNAYSLFKTTSNYIFAGTDNGEIYRTSNFGTTWQLIGSTNYNRITCFAENNNFIFCGTLGGGIFRSSDYGNNWVQIVTTNPLILYVNAIYVKNNVIYVGTSNNGIFKSTDNGNSWVQINNGLTSLNITSLVINRNNDLFAGSYGRGVFRLKNNESIWESTMSNYAYIRSLAIDSNGYLYAGSRDTVYRSWYLSELSPPTLISPVNNKDSCSSSPLMKWNSVNLALTYHLQVSKDQNFNSIDIELTSLSDTSILISGLDYETIYYWRVRAQNYSAVSNWSTSFSFKTAAASPDIPVLLSPPSNATNISEYPSFIWRKSPRAAKYWFQISLNKNFTTITREDSLIVDTTYIVGPLVNNTKFFWRVRALNIGWMSDWSRTDSFTTIISVPPIPQPLYPLFGDVNIPTSTTFRWTKSNNATTYRLQISNDPSFNSFVYHDSTLTDTSRAISSLENGKTYFWRVSAKNLAGESGFSTTYHFTTIITVPLVPVLIYPANNDSNLTTTILFKWNSSLLATQYQIYIALDSLFTNIINDTTWISDTTYLMNSLNNNTRYYWKVRAKNLVGYSNFSTFRKFKTFLNSQVPSWWSFVSNTGNNASISIPISSSPTIGEEKIKNGDAIGVFYLRNDSMFCAGYTIWNYSSNNGIIIWGDNAQTPIKDGFALNELIRFKIWDSKNNKEYPAHVKFLGGKTTYFINEYYIVDSLKAATKIIHQIKLNQGWNLISSYANPINSNLDTICSSIQSSMVLLKDGFGRFYWPQFNIRQISNFDFRNGYQIYMLAPATLTIIGNNVLWDTTKIKLIRGWNMISYLRQIPMRIDSALSSILSKVVLVKNDSGQFYWKEFNVNTIGSMKPGIGYQVYMIDSATFNYPYGLIPLNLLYKKNNIDFVELKKPVFYRNQNRASVSNSILMIELDNSMDNDEIGIFTNDGLLIGSGVVQNKKCFLTIFGDDNLTDNIKEGAQENEELLIKIKSKNEEKIIKNIIVTDVLNPDKKENKLYYKTNSLLKVSISEERVLPTKFTLEQNYPNPFNPITMIKFSIPYKSKVTLDIYNSIGQLVKREIDNIEFDTGTYQIEFNAKHLSSGVYFYKLKADKYLETKKMLLLK
ncbi:MAG TPA: T9SS type A sorting domain-containing protein [Ignavibacteria bacterium]